MSTTSWPMSSKRSRNAQPMIDSSSTTRIFSAGKPFEIFPPPGGRRDGNGDLREIARRISALVVIFCASFASRIVLRKADPGQESFRPPIMFELAEKIVRDAEGNHLPAEA